MDRHQDYWVAIASAAAVLLLAHGTLTSAWRKAALAQAQRQETNHELEGRALRHRWEWIDRHENELAWGGLAVCGVPLLYSLAVLGDLSPAVDAGWARWIGFVMLALEVLFMGFGTPLAGRSS